MNVLVTPDTFEDAGIKIRASKYVAVDTETTGLMRWHEDRLFSIVVSNGEDTFYFNFLDYSGNLGYPEDHTHISYEAEVYAIKGPHLDRKLTPHVISWLEGKKVFMHNAKFDLAMLQNECPLPHMDIHDTMVGARLLYNDHHRYNLDSCVQRDLGLKKSDLVMKFITDNKCYETTQGSRGDQEKKLQFDRVPFGLMYEYACKDAAITYELGVYQLAEIEKENTEKNSFGFSFKDACQAELALTRDVFDIETKGIKIDREYCEKAFEYERDRYKSAEEDFFRETNEKLTDSGEKLGEILQKRGHQLPRTESGAFEISEKVLSKLRDPSTGLQDTVAEVVIRHRDAYKRAHTYFDAFLKYADKNDIIHCDQMQSGTRTGRFSYRDPNLQNVTNDPDDYPFPLKRAFVPRPGKYFVMIDYQQMEFRMMLDYAGEKALIRKIKEGFDPHQATADLTKLDRNTAKTLNFAVLYGVGKAKLAEMLGITPENAARFKRQYFNELPHVDDLIYRCTSRAKIHRKIVNWAGRIYRFDDERFTYKAANALIQGGCADVVKRAMVQVKSNVLLQIHDELLMEFDIGDTDGPLKAKSIMESVYPAVHLPLTCSVEHSLQSWADTNEGLPDFKETRDAFQGAGEAAVG